MGRQISPEITLPMSVAIVDGDSIVLTLMERLLQNLGVPEVVRFEDGKKAWTAIDEGNFDLIIFDWKLPTLSGLALFNRIRSSPRYYNIPILVISGFLHKEDFKILTEFSATSLLEKPFGEAQLEKMLFDLLKEHMALRENAEIVDALIKDISIDPRAALKAVKKLATKLPNPTLLLVEAGQALRTANMLDESEEILRAALEHDTKCIRALTELGKVLVGQNKHREAARALKAAQFMTPSNIERLLLLGEIKLTDLKPEEARKYFRDALSIDAENKAAHLGKTSAEHMQQYVQTNGLKGVPPSVASLLNVIAISLVRSGKIREGMAQYKAALSFVEETSVISRLFFNLGLACLRDSRPDDAIPYFKNSASIGKGSFEKATVYLDIIEKRKAAGMSKKEAAAAAANVEYMEEQVSNAPATTTATSKSTEGGEKSAAS